MAVKRRADFAENRERILKAADAVFVERGVGAPLDLIAQRAEIGRATFFRHFADRRALINEMMDHFLIRLETKSAELPSVGESLFDLSKYFFDNMMQYAPVVDYLRAQSRDDPALMSATARFMALLKPHVEQAKKENLVRQDMDEAEVVISAVMLAAAATTPHIGPEGRRRAYELVFNGLRVK